MSSTAIRARVSAAGARTRRLRRLDRAASLGIVLGGLLVVASVLGILVSLAVEAWPLLGPGRVSSGTRMAIGAGAAGPDPGAGPGAASPAAVAPAGDRVTALALGVDEYVRYAWLVLSNGRFELVNLATGRSARSTAIPGLAGARTTAAAKSAAGNLVAAATADGRAAIAEISVAPRYAGSRMVDVDVDVRDRAVVALDPSGGSIRSVTVAGADQRWTLAGIDALGRIVVWRQNEAAGERRDLIEPRPGERFTTLRLGPRDEMVAGTDLGRILHWDLAGAPRLTDAPRASRSPITALEWAMGGNTWVAGDEAGGLTAWFRTRLHEDDEELAAVRSRRFEGPGAPIASLAMSSRDRRLVAVGTNGRAVSHHITSERRLFDLDGAGTGQILASLSPRNDALVTVDGTGTLRLFRLDGPHPDVTAKALFGRVWYEGYPAEAFVWQSTGATDDFESKVSLVPLIFGTLKATLFAMLFAVPLAVLGALYTSQFVHPSLRSRVKPVVEIMAALPSVVVGFVAGLWLAPVVERNLVGLVLMVGLLPVAGTGGVLVWRVLPAPIARRLKAGTELLLILPVLLAAGWLALQVGPSVERLALGGDARLWLSSALGLTYDPRNGLVVAIALGFAVIPIVFTISDDAFSSVPAELTAASLALGASRWQTALRVVLPTASPGVFSAVMVGFGRAVGETMIVLMATGNTPVTDWSIFNGMRTLSANIAVEVPEAPNGGSLWRVLFVAGGLLFVVTFAVNTAAEIIRQRLRARYRAA